MKKIIFLLVILMAAINVSAQEENVSTTQTDSLKIELKKLQHDYNYLYCSYILDKYIQELKLLSNDLNSSSSQTLINCYHGIYNLELYNANAIKYDSDTGLYNALEEAVNSTKEFVLLKMLSQDFSETEKDIFKSSISTLEKALVSAKTALDYYKLVLDISKKLL